MIQVLQDYYKSHIDVAVGPPRPLVTGESYQELEDRLTTGFFHSPLLSFTVSHRWRLKIILSNRTQICPLA